jgi:hypothetical protein
MRAAFSAVLVLACLAIAGARLRAQAPSNPSGSSQNQPAAGAQIPPAAQTPARVQTQSDQNPFPEDTTDVPVLPTRSSPGTIPGDNDESPAGRIPMPAADVDPVRSPEEAGAAAENQQQGSSSSSAGMSGLFPPADDDAQPQPTKRNRKGQQIDPEHHETAAEDESVGSYYLDNKDWRAALSRYQSALVLDPDNPDVYWGLAEAERHLGNFAEARANYQKVMDYDPGSRHAKEARKALEDPAIANAKPPQSVTSPQQTLPEPR